MGRSPTVYGDSDALCQLITILPDERGDSPKVIDLQVVVGDIFSWHGGHDLKVDIVRLGYCPNCDRACVALQEISFLQL